MTLQALKQNIQKCENACNFGKCDEQCQKRASMIIHCGGGNGTDSYFRLNGINFNSLVKHNLQTERMIFNSKKNGSKIYRVITFAPLYISWNFN